MASAPSEPRPVVGRLDRADCLVSADPQLEGLQREAGSSLGKTLALPQIAAIAQLARKLGIAVSRPAMAAALDHDLELWVRAVPEGDEVALEIDRWTPRPPSGPRLLSLLGRSDEGDAVRSSNEWATDEELRLISLSPEFAEHLGVAVEEAAGQPLTRIIRLDENEAGEMPLILALAMRRSFSGQLVRGRVQETPAILLSGEAVTGADGAFAGFRGTAEIERNASNAHAEGLRSAAFDHALDEALRSPLDRIIESAERIVERADGPLRSDYASYGSDIATAARHLLSVIRSMREDPAQGHRKIDLANLAGEAAVLLEASAEEKNIEIQLDSKEPLPARGEERAIIQIVVNLIGNAIRHSPRDASVTLAFARTDGTASVTVSDQGPGIQAADQQRIFERFERADEQEGGTGLGLAISRRLARSMGGEVTLDSAPGAGARFTLTLPSA